MLAGLAKGRLRVKIPELVRALDGRFNDHHAVLLRLHLDHIDFLDTQIDALDSQVDELMVPFADIRDRLATIPGGAKRTAEVILAEIGTDMSIFPDAGHLASWAGMCPGNNESAGKHYSGRTRKGDVWLKDALTQSAWAPSRTKDDYLSAQFWQIARRRGKTKAAVAVGHSILVIAYHLIDTPGLTNHNLGGDFFTTRLDPQRRVRNLTRQVEALGYQVPLEQAA